MKIVILSVLLTIIPITSNAERFGEKLCKNNPHQFYCIKIKKGQNWHNLFYNKKNRLIVQKLNRFNLGLWKSTTIAIPYELKSYSHFPEQIHPLNEKIIIFSPQFMEWAAYSAKGELVRTGPATGGKRYCKDIKRGCRTPQGEFRVLKKFGPKKRSSKYPLDCEDKNCAPMPWYIKIDNKGVGFHASKKMTGIHSSHGCIHLFYEDARWLNREFMETGTLVYIWNY